MTNNDIKNEIIVWSWNKIYLYDSRVGCLGNTIYYINKTSTEIDSKVEVKKGVIIGYAEDGCVLVKEFYKNAYNQIESRLVAVIPLSKKKALDLKYKCDDQMNKILRLQTQRLR